MITITLSNVLIFCVQLHSYTNREEEEKMNEKVAMRLKMSFSSH